MRILEKCPILYLIPQGIRCHPKIQSSDAFVMSMLITVNSISTRFLQFHSSVYTTAYILLYLVRTRCCICNVNFQNLIQSVVDKMIYIVDASHVD